MMGTFRDHPMLDLNPGTHGPAELLFCDGDIRSAFEDNSPWSVPVVYPTGMPTLMQLSKDVRLLRESIEKLTSVLEAHQKEK